MLSATDVAKALDSPYTLYCDHNVDDSEKDKDKDGTQFLHYASLGVKFETDIIKENYTEVDPSDVDEEYEDEDEEYEGKIPKTKPETLSWDIIRGSMTLEEGFMKALEAMSAGIPAIHGMPMFYLPEGVHGHPDVLEKRRGKSVFGKHHYVVNEVKLATNIREPHIIQAAFYAMMLGHIQQRPPKSFFVNYTRYMYSEYEPTLLNTMQKARRIIDGEEPAAIYNGCKYPWNTYCNNVAIRNNDISLISGIGPVKRSKMTEAGFSTIQDVVQSTNTKLQQINGIGKKTAVNYMAAARAIHTGEYIRKDGCSINIPERSTEMFLDLEGLSGRGNIYLIGCLVRTGGVEKYHPFLAEEKRQDLMLKSFLDFIEGYSDYTMYHWSHYEKAQLRAMMGQHDTGGDHLLEPGVLVDLAQVSASAFAFPMYNNTIKDVAGFLNFRWTHDDVDYIEAAKLYIQHVDSGADCLQRLFDYNRDDCKALRVVYDWLRQQKGMPRDIIGYKTLEYYMNCSVNSAVSGAS